MTCQQGLGPRPSAWLSRAVLLATLICTATPQEAAAVTAVTDWEPGFASFYGGQPDGMDPSSPSYGTSVGSCGYGLLNKTDYPYWSVGALATANHFFQDEPLYGCGECFEVQCLENGPLGDKPGSCQADPKNRTIVIMITDSCPECGSNHLDLQALTWAKIAKPSPNGGRINLQYRRVECVPPADLVVNVDSNYGADRWIRLSINKVGGPAPVKQVQLRGSDSGFWENLNNLWGATWEVGSQPKPPIDVRIIANNNQEVTQADAIPYDKQTGVLQTGVQFRILDPSDVQPSGYVTDASRDTVQLEASAPGGEPSGSQATVQAFEGPPENADPNTPAQNSTSRYNGSSGSNTTSSGGGGGSYDTDLPPPAYEAAEPLPPVPDASPPSRAALPPPSQPSQPTNSSSSTSGSSGSNGTSSSTGGSPSPPGKASMTMNPPSNANTTGNSTSNSPSPPGGAPPASSNSTTNNSTSNNSGSSSNSTTAGGSPGQPIQPSPTPAKSAPAPPANNRTSSGNATAANPPPRRSEDSQVMSPGGQCVCKDNKPYSIFSCPDAKAAGQCKKWWLRAGLSCQKTCGNCRDGCNPLGIDTVTGQAMGEAIDDTSPPTKRGQPPVARRPPILADSSSSSPPKASRLIGR